MWQPLLVVKAPLREEGCGIAQLTWTLPQENCGGSGEVEMKIHYQGRVVVNKDNLELVEWF